MRVIKFIIPLTLLVFFAACDEKSFNPRVTEGPDFSLTPMENEEAELLAIHLSGDLIAPVWLYERVKNELEKIRNKWSDSIAAVNLEFQTYYKVYCSPLVRSWS